MTKSPAPSKPSSSPSHTAESTASRRYRTNLPWTGRRTRRVVTEQTRKSVPLSASNNNKSSFSHETDASPSTISIGDTTATSTNSRSRLSSSRSLGTNSSHSANSSGSTSSRRTGASNTNRKLGTLHGVFLPCLQNILGVILFLRLTSITGQAGCIYTTLIVLTAVTSTLLTGLSLSAICTNGTIQSGGPYYVISRTLGMEIGGALGLLFYLGTTLASTMYVLGAVEALRRTIAWQFDTRWAALVLMWLVAAVVSIGVRYVTMLSSTFLVLVLVSIVSMTLGCILFASGVFDGLLQSSDRVFGDNIWPQYQPDPVTGITPSFFSLLAIFYPSVTGILAGCNRSAVLADPAKSIPRGTLGAIGFTTTIYIITVWLFGMVMANEVLVHDKFVVAAVAWPLEQIVAVGVIFSSVGAALQTCAGAPRVLVAIAMDDVLPFLSFLKPATADDEPTRAVWFTWALASVASLAGNIDHVTPLVTTFFLLMYSGINLSCFFLGYLKSPGFRPTFRYFHWSISLLGFVWCLGLVALVAHWYTALAVLIVFTCLYLYTRQQKVSKNWGDVGNAIRYAVATATLRALAGTQTTDFHAKNWRPQLLTVVDADDCGNPTNLHILALTNQLHHGGGGIHIVSSIMTRPVGMDQYETCELMSHSKELLQRHMVMNGLDDCFPQVSATTSSTSQAICSAVVHSGLGPLSPNTVLMSYPTSRRTPQQMDDYVTSLRGIMNLEKAVVLFQGSPGYGIDPLPLAQPAGSTDSSQSTIDVWWVVHDGGLLLLLPYILSKHERYTKSRLRLFAVTSSISEDPDLLRAAVKDHLRRVRISATVEVVDLNGTSIAQDMREANASTGSSVNLSRGTIPEVNTQHMTVGEVFASEASMPYQTLLEDMETGASASAVHSDSQMSSASGKFFDVELSRILSTEERIQTAMAFNQVLLLHSRRSSLVVTNMPLIRPNESGTDFFQYVDAMCESIDNVLLVRGSGVEVITTYV